MAESATPHGAKHAVLYEACVASKHVAGVLLLIYTALVQTRQTEFNESLTRQRQPLGRRCARRLVEVSAAAQLVPARLGVEECTLAIRAGCDGDKNESRRTDKREKGLELESRLEIRSNAVNIETTHISVSIRTNVRTGT